jgi:uncharacterized protein
MTQFNFRKKSVFVSLAFMSLSMLFFQCRTYYDRNIDYNNQLQSHNYVGAEKSLDKLKLLQKQRNVLLFVLEKGKVAHLQQNYTASNVYFNQADFLIEDYNKVVKDYLVASTMNSQLSVYKPEEFEKVLIHYYKSLNYLYLNNYEGALVEARRINLKLQQLDDKYTVDKNKYGKDAFGHILMGLIYEASSDIGNAFIAYRNALEIYQSAGNVYMNVALPNQLKKDVIRCAFLNGFTDLQNRYEKEFGMKLNENDFSKKELVLFWENGLSPVKEEWSLNFTVLPGKAGFVTFVNADLGLNIPFQLNNSNNVNASDFKMIRVAFPKYTDRQSLYKDITVHLGNKNYKTELIEDVNTIARQTLKDRFANEISSALSRLFVKQVTEIALQKQNKELGAILSAVNSTTEQADTRQWQSLPNQISYARIPLEEESKITTTLISINGQVKSEEFDIPTNSNQLTFMNIYNLESTLR